MDIQTLRTACTDCQKCPLGRTRTNLVFGVGNPEADVLFIGEGPGEQEDLQGEPFVGRSGQLLDKMLACVDFSRKENIYIANMVKCRPPQNRDPSPEEVNACLPWLTAQVEAIRPKIIVCLGRVAAIRLIKPDFKVTREHGQFFRHNGILRMGTYHPAYLLRDPRNKPAAMEDLLRVRAQLEALTE